MTLKIMKRTSQAPPRWSPLKRDLRPSLSGRVLEPDQREDDQADQRHHRDEVLREAEERPVADHRDGELGVEQRAVGLEVDRGQDQERPEHEEVGGARHGPLEELALAEDLDDLAS